MKKILFLICFTVFIWQNSASTQLSAWTEIYLLTFSPGNEIYSLFGHSAIRVRDPMNGTDVLYNYGTFDFNTPNFYLKFIRGNLRYQLSKTTFAAAMQQIVAEGRAVYEQLLNLDQKQKQQLFDLLELNYLPENRYYTYRFIHRNCATQIRDLLQELIPKNMVFPDEMPSLTYRDLIHEYTRQRPWIMTGVDLLLNATADSISTPWGSMFLPDYLSAILRKTKLRSDGNNWQQLTRRPIKIMDEHLMPKIKLVKPNTVFVFVLILFLGINISTRISYEIKWFSRQIVFLLTGIIGLLVMGITLISHHPEITTNLNLFWLLPSIACYIIGIRSLNFNSYITFTVWGFVVIVNLFFILFRNMLPQAIPFSLIPVQLMLISAALFEIFHKKMTIHAAVDKK